MFPLLAVGAFITGTAIVAATASNASKSSKPTSRRSQEVEPPVSPAAYVIVPIKNEEGKQAKSPSLVELVGKLSF